MSISPSAAKALLELLCH